MRAEERIKEIFAQALERKSPAEREKYLAEACQGEPELRRQVDSLLRAHEQAGDFLGKTIQLPATDFVTEHTGTMIGRYKLLEKIGEGGFGVVFMAEQVEPLQRKVAIKIIKAGMDTREVVARFEAERQALALMDHPNIARVLDAGATEAGRPYFVMELVRGIPITDYCDQKNLSTTERLQLFMKVCQAVQHAHQKGIIHRDLKPNNVLVTLHDGEPVPKVIDFGVAKALGQKLTAKTLFTGFAQMIGTPTYMSPEQAELSGLDVDTRSDIYSLGVLLYELLTGVTPFDAETLCNAALDEVRRMIRETEPLKPSTRLQTLGDKLTEVAKHRQTEPTALRHLVRGDLDWIVMKALEKNRQRRYETASDFARDIERHLGSEPVSAAAPGVGYRTRKFVRRHRARLAVAGLVGLILGLAAVGVRLGLKNQSSHHALQAMGTNAVFTTAQSGDAEALRRLLDANPRLVEEHDASGETPLAYAAQAGMTNTLRLLLARGAAVDATNRSGLTPLLNAAANNRAGAVVALLGAGANPNLADDSGVTPLHAASLFGSAEIGRALLSKGARTDAVALSAKITALQQAAMLGHADFVELLLAHGALAETRDANGNTPLHAAASGQSATGLIRDWNRKLLSVATRESDNQGLASAVEEVSNRLARVEATLAPTTQRAAGDHRRVAELLLTHKAVLEATNRDGCTPLLVAALFTNRPVAEVLIAHKANLNTRGPRGLTALAVAASKGDVVIVSLLLEAGADASIPDSSGFTPLHTAVESGHRPVVEALLTHGADPNLALPDGQTPLHTAAGRGDVELLRLLLDKGAFLHARCQIIGTPLSLAVQGGRKEAVQFLLDRGAKLDVAAQQSGLTPLHWAALLGNPNLVRLLLEHGAPVNAMSSWLGTPLNAAAGGRWGAEQWYAGAGTLTPTNFTLVARIMGSDSDYTAVLELLLAAKADVNAREQGYQGTPLVTAVQAGNVAAVDALLAAGADVSARNTVGETPLHAASKIRPDAAASVVSNIVVRLLKAGASPDALDDRRATPLHAAANAGKPIMAALLIAAGASVNLAGPNLYTPLHLAVYSGNRHLVELLLVKGADPERRNVEGFTTLHLAVAMKSKDLVALLLQHDADVNSAGPGGTTALMLGVSKGDTNLVKLLLDAGAKVNLGDTNGTTPLITSANAGELGMMTLLLNHEAKINATDRHGWTAFMVAAASGQVAAARLLLGHGAEIDVADENRATPLLIAAKSGRLDMVKFLLERGAAVQAKDNNDFTALHEAADRGHAEIVELLLARGASTDWRGKYESTPMHGAANGAFTNEARYVAVVRVLLAHGADVNARMRQNHTPLHRAAASGRPQIIQVLLAAGADPSARDDNGNTALDWAIAGKHNECVELLRTAFTQPKPPKAP